jgi:hypothetical protein
MFSVYVFALSMRNRQGVPASATRELANQLTWTLSQPLSLRSEYKPELETS